MNKLIIIKLGDIAAHWLRGTAQQQEGWIPSNLDGWKSERPDGHFLYSFFLSFRCFPSFVLSFPNKRTNTLQTKFLNLPNLSARDAISDLRHRPLLYLQLIDISI